jgi:hypothetical protein
VRRLGQDAERASEKADDDLESGQANGRDNGTGGRFVLLLIGYGVRHAEASLSAMMARAAKRNGTALTRLSGRKKAVVLNRGRIHG